MKSHIKCLARTLIHGIKSINGKVAKTNSRSVLLIYFYLIERRGEAPQTTVHFPADSAVCALGCRESRLLALL